MAYARHVTLSANVVSTFTVPVNENASAFEVLNRSGAGHVYISYDGTAAPADPTVGGDDFDVVPAAVGAAATLRRIGVGNIVFKVISAAGTAISVRSVA